MSGKRGSPPDCSTDCSTLATTLRYFPVLATEPESKLAANVDDVVESCCMKFFNYTANFRKYTIITILATLQMTQNIQIANAGEDRSYEKVRLLLVEKIEKILISGGACQSKKDCLERKLLFVSPAKEGIAISTYSVSDPAILRRISEEAIGVFYTTDKVSIEVEHFSFTKEDELRSFFKPGKPFVTIKLER